MGNRNGSLTMAASASALLAVGTSIALAILSLPWVTQFPAGLIRDDGYFYAQIAYNIGTAGQSSFDGVNLTDGYHQLWCYLLAALSFVLQFFTTEKGVHLTAYISLNILVIFASARIASRTWLGRTAFFLLVALCSFLMEGHLALLLVMLGFAIHEAELDRRRWNWGMMLAPLARIDSVLVFAPLLLRAMLRKDRDGIWSAALPLLTGIGLHLGLMKLIHGSLASVSSQSKAAIAGSQGIQLFNNLFHGTESLPIPINPMPLIGIVLAIVAVAQLVRKPSREAEWMILAGGAVFMATHLALNTARPWYFTIPYGCFLWVILRVSEASEKRQLAWSGAVALACLALLGLGYRQALKFSDEALATREFIQQMDTLVPGNELIYQVDGSGYIGWTSQRRVVNGDGLVNSHDYLVKLRRRQLSSYLVDNNIRYLITNKWDRQSEDLVRVGGLVVKRSQAEPLLEKSGNGRYFFTQLILWRLR